MRRREICEEFARQAEAVTGHGDGELTAEQLTQIDDWWMPFLFKLREEWHRQQILLRRESKTKAVSA